MKHGYILSYNLLIPFFLHVFIALTVTNTCSAGLFDVRVGWIIPERIGAALILRCVAPSGFPMPLSCTILDLMFAAQSSPLSFRISNSPLKLSELAVSEMVEGALSSTLLTRWLLITLILQEFNISVRSPERSFTDPAGGKGDLLDNLNAAAPSCWKSD